MCPGPSLSWGRPSGVLKGPGGLARLHRLRQGGAPTRLHLVAMWSLRLGKESPVDSQVSDLIGADGRIRTGDLLITKVRVTRLKLSESLTIFTPAVSRM